MTVIRVYIRIVGSTKPPHWLPHYVPDSLLLQEISYQTFVNGVATLLHRNKKGMWPQFPLMTPICKIENFKQARVLGPYTIHATPILLLHAPYKPTTIIVVPLH